jgi:hypothetical protein
MIRRLTLCLGLIGALLSLGARSIAGAITAPALNQILSITIPDRAGGLPTTWLGYPDRPGRSAAS